MTCVYCDLYDVLLDGPIILCYPFLLQSLSEFKLALRQESSDSTPLPVVGPLDLCKAVHKFHFQLLVLVGSYIKLLALLEKPMQTSPVKIDQNNLQFFFQTCFTLLLFFFFPLSC